MIPERANVITGNILWLTVYSRVFFKEIFTVYICLSQLNNSISLLILYETTDTYFVIGCRNF